MVANVLEQALGFNLYRTAQLFRRELMRALDAYDLTPEQWQVMAVLWSGARLSQAGIVELTLKDKHSVSRLVGRLEDKGWVKKAVDRGDRRITWVQVTAKGLQFREEVPAKLHDHFASIYRSLSAEDHQNLMRLLRQLRATLGDTQQNSEENTNV